MRRYIERRYGGRPTPRHIWLDASVEDNNLRGRIDAMRALKEQHHAVTFLSVTPYRFRLQLGFSPGGMGPW